MMPLSCMNSCQSKKAPKLPNLQYAVVGLGDSSYEFFCQTAKDFDAFLSKQGATAFHPRLDCDVDYESAATAWRAEALDKVEEALKSEQGAADVVQLPLGQSFTGSISVQQEEPIPSSTVG